MAYEGTCAGTDTGAGSGRCKTRPRAIYYNNITSITNLCFTDMSTRQLVLIMYVCIIVMLCKCCIIYIHSRCHRRCRSVAGERFGGSVIIRICLINVISVDDVCYITTIITTTIIITSLYDIYIYTYIYIYIYTFVIHIYIYIYV